MSAAGRVRTHHLKTAPPYFDLVWEGVKTFEVRFDDRGYQRGDSVVLHEYDRTLDCECIDRLHRNRVGCLRYSGRSVTAEVGVVLATVPAQQGRRQQDPQGHVTFSLLHPTTRVDRAVFEAHRGEDANLPEPQFTHDEGQQLVVRGRWEISGWGEGVDQFELGGDEPTTDASTVQRDPAQLEQVDVAVEGGLDPRSSSGHPRGGDLPAVDDLQPDAAGHTESLLDVDQSVARVVVVEVPQGRPAGRADDTDLDRGHGEASGSSVGGTPEGTSAAGAPVPAAPFTVPVAAVAPSPVDLAAAISKGMATATQRAQAFHAPRLAFTSESARGER